LFEEVPTLACRRTPERVAVLVQLKVFRAAYRKAWLAFAAGFHDVVFPHGTWEMVAVVGASVAAETRYGADTWSLRGPFRTPRRSAFCRFGLRGMNASCVTVSTLIGCPRHRIW
jgi:hypothetical protein